MMVNYIIVDGDPAYAEAWPIDWIKTFSANASNLAFSSSTPVANLWAVAATGSIGSYTMIGIEGVLFNNAAVPVFRPGNVTVANTRFGGTDIFLVTSATTVSGSFCSLPTSASIYRRVSSLSDYTLTYGSISADVSGANYTPASGRMGFYLGSTYTNTTTSTSASLVAIQNSGGTIAYLTLAALSDGRTTSAKFTPNKVIPIPFGYRLHVENATAYYAEIVL